MKDIWVQFCKERDIRLDTIVAMRNASNLESTGGVEEFDFDTMFIYIEWLEEQIDP